MLISIHFIQFSKKEINNQPVIVISRKKMRYEQKGSGDILGERMMG